MNTFVSHLECSYTGEKYNKNEIHNLSKVGKPILVKYYLDQIKEKITKQEKAIPKNIPTPNPPANRAVMEVPVIQA